MAQVAAVKKELFLSGDQILAYSVQQPLMRGELINRILGVLEGSAEVVPEL